MQLNQKETEIKIKAIRIEKSKEMSLQKKDISMNIKIKNITGILLGPQTITYQILIKKGRLQRITERYWSFLSIVSAERTYDIQFEKKDELINFYIAINELVSRSNPQFDKIVDRRFLRIHLTRMKLEHIAEMQGLSMIQLFKKSLYIKGLSLPEITVNDRKYKFQVLSKLNGLIQYTPVVNHIEINDLYQLSQALINDALAIETEISINMNRGLKRDDSNINTNDVQSASYMYHPGMGYSSTINSDNQYINSLTQQNFMYNKAQQDFEEQRKVDRIKSILATSIRSIQRNAVSKAKEKKSILAGDSLVRRFQMQKRKSLMKDSQSHTNLMLRSGNVSTLHLYKNDKSNIELSDHSSISPRRYHPLDENNNTQLFFQEENQNEEENKEKTKSDYKTNGDNSKSPQPIQKKKKSLWAIFVSRQKNNQIKQGVKQSVQLQLSELIKVFNLSKKFYMIKQRKLPKIVRKKIEEALNHHLQKKILQCNKMADFNQKLEFLNDMVDFYLRHCDQESEHFNIIANRVITKYQHMILPSLLEERLKRKVDYNQLRIKYEEQQQMYYHQNVIDNNLRTQTIVSQPYNPQGKQQYDEFQSTFKKVEFKQIVELKRAKTRKMDLF
ncbi:UNKNOWN [Stylonychia lemnae]|uniref:Uncharacterized protein n=1 Tax=Stylonychia lemnae TaxID=5949 RepID=A0A077ZVM0_STYLE|nr:UNKNOWN [Stylonychia lemnae]|eukprot:CDW73975.1 UNKNOWN [Stylonychia lemnae]